MPEFSSELSHSRLHALSVGSGRGDVVSVAGNAAAQHLAVYLGAARHGVLVRFDDEYARALAERYALGFIERTAGLVVERVERVETGIRQAGHGVRTAGDHDVRLAAAYYVRRHGDGHGTRRAGVGDVIHDAARAETERDVVRDRGDGHFQHVLRLRFIGIRYVIAVKFLYRYGAAHAAAYHYADAVGVLFHVDAGIGHGFFRRLDAERGGSVLAFRSNELRIFGAYVRVALGVLHAADFLYSDFSRHGVVEALVGAAADGAHEAEAGDYYSVH